MRYTIIVIAILAVIIGSCSNNVPKLSSIKGKWEIVGLVPKNISTTDTTRNMNMAIFAMALSVSGHDTMTFGDGNAYTNRNHTGTYTFNGSTLTINNDMYTCSTNGDTLYLRSNAANYILKLKQVR